MTATGSETEAHAVGQHSFGEARAAAIAPNRRARQFSSFDSDPTKRKREVRLIDVETGRIRAVDPSTGKRTQTLQLQTEEGEHIVGLAFSPDGQSLAVGWNRKNLKLFDVQTGKEQRAFEGLKGSPFALALSADGKLLASGSGKGECILWDAQTGEVKRTLRDLGGPVTAVAFSPDGKTLATGVAKAGNREDQKTQNSFEQGEVKLWPVTPLLE